MKKNIALLLFATLILSAGFSAEKKIELKVWESSGSEQSYIMYAIKEFKRVNPKVRIRYEPVESTDARNKIELDGPAGVGADVFVAPHDHIGALVTGNHILPVDDADEYMKDFLSLAKKAAAFDGVVYGYPLGAETYILFYNKDILKNPLKTWEEIISYAQNWNVPVENKFAISWAVTDPYYSFMFLDSFGATLFGPDGNNPKEHNLNSPEAIEGMKYFQKLRNLVLNIPAGDVSRDFCHASFHSGASPMIITGSWKINEFKKDGMNFGISTLPEFPGKNKPASSFSGVRLAFVSSYSEHPEEAKEFAKFITSREMLQKRFEITDQIPPRNDIQINDEYSKAIVNQLKYSKPMPTIIQLGRFWQCMGPAVSGIWDGDDVEKTMNIAAAAMDAIR